MSVRLLVLACVGAVVGAATLSAHVVKGRLAPAAATAFVSSPTAGSDPPIPVRWGTAPAGATGLSVACFYVANTSPARLDRPGWPRVTAAGFELPGQGSGFALVEPLDGDWELVENVGAALDGIPVTLDFAIVARANPAGWKPRHPHELPGIEPEQAPTRGSGTRFCVSGPFPETVAGTPDTIEQVLNGVVVRFDGVDDVHRGRDLGVWDNPARLIPLYP
ncbi:MAG: hypothetical protein R2745_24525 [Vicinamibacterales bacterium]